MNRRQFLTSASATAVAASVGGCLSNVLGGEPEVFRDITTEDTSLIVTFSEDTDIQSVNLITSDGTRFNGTRLSPGEYRAAIGLISTSIIGLEYAYAPGTYTLVAVDSEGTEYEREITLRPNTSITDVSFLREQWAGTYDEWRRYTAPVLRIDNSVSDSNDAIVGPDIVVDSGVVGNVPQPTSLSADNSGTTGLLPVGETNSSEVLVVGANTTRVALTSYLPFTFSGDKYNSETAVRRRWAGKTVDATLVLKTLMGISTDFTVKYTGTVQKAFFFLGDSIFYLDNSKVVSTATATTTR